MSSNVHTNSSTISITSIGIAAVPCFLGDREPVLQRLTPDVIGSRDIYVVYHPHAARIARVRRVIDFAVDVVHSEARLLAGRG